MAQDQIPRPQTGSSKSTKQPVELPVQPTMVGSLDDLLKLDPKTLSNVRILPRHAKITSIR